MSSPIWIAALSAAMVANVSVAQNLGLDLSFQGMINGEMLDGTGSGNVDASGGPSSASVTFSSIPTSFNPLSTSLLSNLCTLAFSFGDNTQNLLGLTGGTYEMTRIFSWAGLDDSNITVTSSVTNNEGMIDSDTTLMGTYNGPNDLVAIRSYAITWLPGSTPGEFFEAGSIVVERESTDELLLVQFASIFSGFDGQLSGPQVGTAIFDASFDGETFDLNWEGEFETPVPAPGAASLGLALLGLGARRSRPA